jgi:hypothetical protein
MRHGCQFCAFLLSSTIVALSAHAQATRVRARTFDIAYEVNDAALPLDSVQLWYTQDEGQTWVEFGLDEDRQSPITFHAPDEGTFGFFLVMSNATGASSAAPTTGTPPQEEVLVDFTPPVVQLHALRTTSSLGETVVQIRWTAIDTQLSARPIEIAYRRPPDTRWVAIGGDPLANTGRYDWRVPDSFTGTVSVRVTVSDLGGHRADSETQTIEVGRSPATRVEPPPQTAPATGRDDATLAGSKRAKERIAKLLGEASAHRERGEYSQAVARLRDVIKLDPQRTEAFVEMGAALSGMGDHERAIGAYDLALKQNPNLRSALQGSALVYKEKNDFPAAAERLRTILRYNPHDAEVWMNLGDVAIYQGDEALARDCYTRASQINPKAVETIAEAQQRLALMLETSRGIKRTGK